MKNNSIGKGISLTEDQHKAFNDIQEFLSSNDDEVFILEGYAGTGKTTLIHEVTQKLKSQKKYFEVMAPTGRAAKILREKTEYGQTIHRGIYNLDKFETINDESEDEAEKSFHYHFPISDNRHKNRVCIIDEASMISDVESKQEFFTFGTDRLLSDILTYMKIPDSNNKLLIVGDPAQLPPVTDSISRALSAKYFKSKGINLHEYEMTGVIRQNEGSTILENANNFRKVLNTSERNEVFITLNNDVKYLSPNDVIETYINEFPSPKVGNGVIINFSNAQCLSYNQMIREKLFPDSNNITTGDIIIINKNNYDTYGVELFNGDMAQVTWASPTTEAQSAPVYIKEGGEKVKKIITLNFRDIRIKIPHYEHEIECKIIDTLLNNPFADLSENEVKALYINFNIRFNETQKKRTKNGLPRIKPGSEQFKDLVKNDPYYNALRIKYGYAITCHKSQGGEWNTAFVNFDGRVGIKDDHLRWGYTAITRASTKLYVINPPYITPFSAISFSSISNLGNITNEAIQYNNIPQTPYHSPDSHPAKKHKYHEVLKKVRNTPFTIERVETRDYHEMYYFIHNKKIIRIDAHHNSAGIFSRFITQSELEAADQLLNCVNSPKARKFTINYIPSTDFFSKLYSKMRIYCDEFDIEITNAVEKTDNYYVIYYLYLGEKQFASIQFYFNNNCQFSRANPKVQDGPATNKLTYLIQKFL